MLSKYKILTAVFGAVIIVFVTFWFVRDARSTLAILQEAPRLTKEMLPQLKKEDLVVIEGSIVSGPEIYKDFVMGVYEEYVDGYDEEGWEIVSSPPAELKIKLNTGPQVSVFYSDVVPYGPHVTMAISPEERYRGYTLGMSLTSIAIVSALDPLSFDAVSHHMGFVPEYKETLNTMIWIYQVAMVVVFLIYGLVLLYSYNRGGLG